MLKLLERLFAYQLLNYLNTERLLPEMQSAYRAFHSTETAVFKDMADILLALDRSEIAFLIFLDLSSAFDTIDHATLLEILYGLGATCCIGFSPISLVGSSLLSVTMPGRYPL